MTPEKKTELRRHTPWYAKAGAGCRIVPISRFVTPTIFALKTGGYGCLFSLTGIDEESLTDQELDARVRSIEGALHGLPDGSCLYQYARVLSGFDIPRQKKYSDPVTETFVNDRLTFLENTGGFRKIALHWCLTFEPSQKNPFAGKPNEKAEDRARMLSSLQKTATILESHLRSTVGLRLLAKHEAFPFFSYLFNLEPWCEHDHLLRDIGVDRQIVKSTLSWHSDHLRVGKRYVQMFSLMDSPEISRPCQFSGLMTLDCDSVLCTSWRPKSAAAARAEISAQ
jgi:type IV secretion system protein VirB4